VNVPGLLPRTAADLERARDGVPWVADDDLRDLESKSSAGATVLGLFTWGGGPMYAGDMKLGLAGLAALAAWVAVSNVIPAGVVGAGYWIVGAVSAVWSYRRSRAVNKFVSIRNELALRQGPDPSTYRLLAAAAAANPALLPALPALPGPASAPVAEHHAQLRDQLRKLLALHRAGVLHQAEHRERKIDLLTDAAPATRAELDELLYVLLPLADEGALAPDDFEFLKQLGASR
jgi:hypothetical protein